MSKFLFGEDDQGWPVMLADSAVAEPEAKPPPEPTPDPVPAPEPVPEPPTRMRPHDIESDEWEHRLDAVRDAARENDLLSEGDVQDFLVNRLVDASKFDPRQFVADVRAQRVDDLVDILDHRLRSEVDGMIRSRRYVRLVAPKGWVKRVQNGLTDAEHLTVARRLVKRGWDAGDISKHVLGKIANEERRNEIIKQFTGREVEQ